MICLMVTPELAWASNQLLSSTFLFLRKCNVLSNNDEIMLLFVRYLPPYGKTGANAALEEERYRR